MRIYNFTTVQEKVVIKSPRSFFMPVINRYVTNGSAHPLTFRYRPGDVDIHCVQDMNGITLELESWTW